MTLFSSDMAQPARAGGGRAGHGVYRSLRDRIVRLDLPPGTSLVRADLAQTYGVSLTPLRDALQQLGKEGLVHIYPQSRTLVTPIDLRAVAEAQFMRIALETEVVRRLAGGMPTGGMDALRDLSARQAAVSADDPPQFQELDEAFHQLLFVLAGHEDSQRLMRSHAGHLERVRRLSLPEEGAERTNTQAVLAGHGAILDALGTGDAPAAIAAMRAHLQRTVHRVEEKRAAWPDWFSSPVRGGA